MFDWIIEADIYRLKKQLRDVEQRSEAERLKLAIMDKERQLRHARAHAPAVPAAEHWA